MKLAIAVLASPFSHQASDSAYQFTCAALQRGHEIYRIFFYHDGVHNGNLLAVPPQDETHIVNRWSELASERQIDLIVCVASALRRGVLDDTEAKRYQLPLGNLARGFTISGLGQLIDAGLSADRLITFGA